LAERRRDFRLDLGELGLEDHQQALHPGAHLWDDLWVVPQGMELVTHLLTEVKQVVTLGQTLL
jgi:hypothetical protein